MNIEIEYLIYGFLFSTVISTRVIFSMINDYIAWKFLERYDDAARWEHLDT